MPPSRAFRAAALSRRRREYLESVPQHFEVTDAERSEYEKKTLHQILIDVPRTSTSSPIFQSPLVQRALERVLYIWALRHPASGRHISPYLPISRHLSPSLPISHCQVRAGRQRRGDPLLPRLACRRLAARIGAHGGGHGRGALSAPSSEWLGRIQ